MDQLDYLRAEKSRAEQTRKREQITDQIYIKNRKVELKFDKKVNCIRL
jgi:hypothetical protein